MPSLLTRRAKREQDRDRAGQGATTLAESPTDETLSTPDTEAAMEKTFPTWAWIALGFYFAVCSIGGSYLGPFIALGCGYLAAKSRYR